MSSTVAAIVGSGTLPFTRGILSSIQRGYEAGGEGVRTGIQVMVGNPEDLVAVDTFVASGVTVGTTPLEIVGPHINPLPRCRHVVVQNLGANDLYISHHPNVEILDSFQLAAGGTAGADRSIALPLLHNTSVWAKTAISGTSQVGILIF